MKVLVTGGAGFIGSHIVDKLVENGHVVRILDNLDHQVHGDTIPDYINPGAEFIRGDVRNSNTLAEAIKDIDVIFHEAACVGVGQSMYMAEKYVDTNSLGTAKLLDVLVNKPHGVKKLIVASSMSIYGEGAYRCDDCGVVYPSLREEAQFRSGQWDIKCPHCGRGVSSHPTTEKKPLEPTSIYAITKKDQEELCMVTGRTYGIPTVALRYFNVYGPRQSLSNPYTGVCAIFSSRIKSDNSPFIFEDGLQSRDFVSVHDVVQANVLAMESSNANYQIFNVGSGNPTSILEIAMRLIQIHDRRIHPKVLDRYRKGDIRHIYADISRIRNSLGYRPKTDIDIGLRELVYWSMEKDSVDKFIGSYNELLEKGLVAR